MTGEAWGGAWALINSGAVLALLGYVVSNERRLTKLETIIQLLTKEKR